jgi:hypothetical protein
MKNNIDLDAILQQMAAEHRLQLPDRGVIWFRAQILRKTRQKERIERPMEIMRLLVALTGALILLVFLADNWTPMLDALRHGSGFLLPLLISTLAASFASAVMFLRSPVTRQKHHL